MPDERHASAQDPFNIVLCLAGAVSAGAYTAGVIDFLLEALDGWEHHKREHASITPDHAVCLIGATGASAGGMTAGLLAAELRDRQAPVRQPYLGLVSTNRLYRSWVTQIDAKALLDTRQAIAEPVTALLNADMIESILEAAFRGWVPKQRPAYLHPRFSLGLTLSNLAGIPYRAEFRSSNDTHYLGMLKHADLFRMDLVDADAAPAANGLSLAWSALGGATSESQLFKTALLATGAFPFALPARRFTYGLQERQALYGNESGLQPAFLDQAQYRFDSVDGGLMNNIPVEFAEGLLNERHANSLCDGALLAIAPFPEGEVLVNGEGAAQAMPGLGDVLLQMLGALKNQARFKPEFIRTLIDEQDYRRFMIAPRRCHYSEGSANHRPYLDGEAAIASGGLGGFSGFYAEAFRMHDFVLGRRNAQRFLSAHFMLPEDHPLFASWRTQGFADHYRREGHLPIIPVMPGLSPEIEELPWPTLAEAELKDLTHRIGLRLDYLAKPLARSFGASGFGLQVINLAYMLFRKQIINAAKQKVKADLLSRKQFN